MRKLRELTDAEEAEIQRQIASDPDAPEATEAQLKTGRPFAEALPELAEAIKRSRGRPRVDAPKEAVTLRVAPRFSKRRSFSLVPHQPSIQDQPFV